MYFKLKQYCSKVYKNKALKNYSTIKIGGKAKYVCFPKTKTDVVDLVNYLNLKKIKYFVLGAGSNVLINSRGFNGVVIKLDNLNEIYEFDNTIQVGAGVRLSSVVNYYLKKGYCGFEQAVGIPGTIGGAVVMNAGAYSYKTENVVKGVTFIKNGKVDYYVAEQCEFSYRHSIFDDSYIILSVDLKKELGNVDIINNMMRSTMELRKKLPHQPSLGSVFKRHNEVIVSRLIDSLGLKGKRVGDAMVSFEHAGVIVNLNNASSKDVKQLISLIKNECYQKEKIELQEEIRYLN